MVLYALCFLLGDLALQEINDLPGKVVSLGFILFLILLIKYRAKVRYSLYFIAVLCGFVWTLLYSNYQLFWSLPKNLEGVPVSIVGCIATLPESRADQLSFLFDLNKFNALSVHGKVKLIWKSPNVKLRVGDQWLLSVRLKKVHSLMNPGSFDYEAWAFQEGVRANGSVLNSKENHLMSHSWFRYPINQLRQRAKDRIELIMPHSATSPWIIALAYGERYGVSQYDWEVLRNTGTNHLMAIAGLHIGAISGFIFVFVSWIWRRFPKLILMLPSSHAGAIAALIVAFFYSAMAGFSIPTQRACIMLVMFSSLLLLRRTTSSWFAWSIALLSVLIVNPLTVLSESFYLSFGCVAVIIYSVSGRIRIDGWWSKWGRIQWIITIGLFPLSIGLFHQFSFVSFIANAIAIPWVAFIIVPLIMLGSLLLVISTKLARMVLILADYNLGYLWRILNYFSHLHWAVWYHSVSNQWMIIAGCVGIVILLFPRGLPGRWLGVAWLLPMVLYQSNELDKGEVKFTLLDVGQGLSAVVRTSHHILVFDAGSRLSENADMGASVVTPFLRSLNSKQIDMLVVSHGDNDHIGGANAILNTFNVNVVKTSVPEKFPMGVADYCLLNQSWVWDDVQFRFLYPAPQKLGLDNDSSCVLKISHANKAILLTGDIEKSAENYLVQHIPQALRADILVAPHHGSKTSAEDEFIRAVNPFYVLFPVGYLNRYHFPHEEVIKKYHDLHIKSYDTVNSGAIEFTMSAQDENVLPVSYRSGQYHFWR